MPIEPLTEIQSKSAPKTLIYFIQSDGPGGFIKIGLATSISARFSQLQVGTPHLLRILKTIKGDRRKERLLHSQFAHLHHRGEWYVPGEDLIAFIDRPVAEPVQFEEFEPDNPLRDTGEWLERRPLEHPEEYLAAMSKDLSGGQGIWRQHAAWVRRASEKHGKPIPEAVKQFLTMVC